MNSPKHPKYSSGPCPATFADVMSIEDKELRAKTARIYGYRGYWLDKATSGNGLNAQLNRSELLADGYYEEGY